MPDKFRNKRKLEKQQKAAAKHGHGHTNGNGMATDEFDQHARGADEAEFPEGHTADDR